MTLDQQIALAQNTRNIISFSGGKDSTALVLWARENLSEFETVFCDTGWEHPLTYAYIEYINTTVLDNKLITLKSSKYTGFEDLAIKKKRAPSTKARFCTEELKIKPMQNYIHEKYNGKVKIYLGIRADESFSRSTMQERNFDDTIYGCYVNRPLLRWTADDVFMYLEKFGVEPNPLYRMGMKRVGCMPCIMSNHGEMRSIIRQFPEIIEKLVVLENTLGRTFFPPRYIPDWVCTRTDEATGKRIPTIADVVRYLADNPDQEVLFEQPSCLSYYNICE